jgi:hypothetical protein
VHRGSTRQPRDTVSHLAQTHRLGEQRCSETLDSLESKRLADGSLPAEHRYDRHIRAMVAQSALVCGLGEADRRRMNPRVSGPGRRRTAYGLAGA